MDINYYSILTIEYMVIMENCLAQFWQYTDDIVDNIYIVILHTI